MAAWRGATIASTPLGFLEACWWLFEGDAERLIGGAAQELAPRTSQALPPVDQ